MTQNDFNIISLEDQIKSMKEKLEEIKTKNNIQTINLPSTIDNIQISYILKDLKKFILISDDQSKYKELETSIMKREKKKTDNIQNMKIYENKMNELQIEKLNYEKEIKLFQNEVNSISLSEIPSLKRCILETEIKCNGYQEEISNVEAMQIRTNTQHGTIIKLNKCRDIVKKLSARGIGIIGMLCDVIQPRDPSYIPALMAVLGKMMTSSIVVTTRRDAIETANYCTRLGMTDISVEIAQDASQATSAYTSKYSTHSNYKNLQECIIVSNVILNAIVHKLLGPWVLFNGSYKSYCEEQSSAKRMNIVTIDGCRFMRDGEIRTNNFLSISNENIINWPGRQCNNIQRPDSSRKFSTIEASNALKFHKNELNNLREKLNERNSRLVMIQNLLRDKERILEDVNIRILSIPKLSTWDDSDETGLALDKSKLQQLSDVQESNQQNLNQCIQQISKCTTTNIENIIHDIKLEDNYQKMLEKLTSEQRYSSITVTY